MEKILCKNFRFGSVWNLNGVALGGLNFISGVSWL